MRPPLALALAFLAIAAPTSESTGAPLTYPAVVVHVHDGDTVDVRIDGRRERVRYIGIDAPEIAHDGVGGERGGEAARRLNQALVGGRHVRLELDRERRDRYGRLLAYVWVDTVIINLEMIRRGHARVLTIPPNVRHEGWFARAQAEAQAARRGLWGDGDPGRGIMWPGRSRPRSGNWRSPGRSGCAALAAPCRAVRATGPRPRSRWQRSVSRGAGSPDSLSTAADGACSAEPVPTLSGRAMIGPPCS